MSRLKSLVVLIAFLLPAVPAAAQEYVPVNRNADHRAIALKIATDFVAPHYEALAARFDAQEKSWETFCAAPSAPGFEDMRSRFSDAAKGWAEAEVVRYGPVSVDFRYERIAYWPERKNDVARGLTRLLSETGPLTPDIMYGKSVAVQGLSALERLLYEDGAQAALLADDDGAKRRCAAGQAIAGNLVRIAGDIRTGWTALTDELKTADAMRTREAATRLATDLLTVFQIAGDQKLDVPMGETIDDTRPKAAQYWRSGLSNATLALNMKSAADLTFLILGQGDPATNTVGAIETAQGLAESLPGPIPDLVADKAGRSRLYLLRGAVRGARDLATAYVPAALGITVGFNSLDGD